MSNEGMRVSGTYGATILAGHGVLPAEAREHAAPGVVERRHDMQRRAGDRMRQLQAPRMQQQAMHAEMHAPQAVVIAAAMAGVADDVVRDVVQMLADLPVAAGLGLRLEQ